MKKIKGNLRKSMKILDKTFSKHRFMFEDIFKKHRICL